MSVEEFRSWVEFYEEEPFGDVRADLRAGVVAATVARMLGGKTARPKPIDFMPIVRQGVERSRARSGDRSAEMRAALALAFKGRIRHVVIKRKGERHHGA